MDDQQDARDGERVAQRRRQSQAIIERRGEVLDRLRDIEGIFVEIADRDRDLLDRLADS